jgi:hypothetical protein
MSIFNCKSMRAAVILGVFLFILGLLFQIPPLFFRDSAIFPVVIVSFLGLAAMAISITILLLTACVALLPAVNRRLDACQH